MSITETSRYVCFKCRVCFHGARLCPHCKQEMHYVGTHFRAPKRANKRAWKILEAIGFAGSFRHGAGALPKSMSEVPKYLAAKRNRQTLTAQKVYNSKGAPVYDSRGKWSNRFQGVLQGSSQ